MGLVRNISIGIVLAWTTSSILQNLINVENILVQGPSSSLDLHANPVECSNPASSSSSSNISAITNYITPSVFEGSMRNTTTEDARGLSKEAAPIYEKKNARNSNLVAFTAIGSMEGIRSVYYNAKHHFHGWDCIVFVHVNETILPETSLVFLNEICSVTRLPGAKWSHFLIGLNPAVTSAFQHIAVVLDDVLAPRPALEGEDGVKPVNVNRLLRLMNEYNFSTISPSVDWNNWAALGHLSRGCVSEINIVETFFQIFSKEMWDCYWRLLDHDNAQAFCVDLILYKACPIGRMGVDESMRAYHVGNSVDALQYLPKPFLKDANLTTETSFFRAKPDAKPNQNHALCRKYHATVSNRARSKRNTLWCPPNGTIIPCPKGFGC